MTLKDTIKGYWIALCAVLAGSGFIKQMQEITNIRKKNK